MSYDQAALDAASREVHMHLLREGSSWGTKACEEMGRIFMTAYLKAAARPEVEPPFDSRLVQIACANVGINFVALRDEVLRLRPQSSRNET